MDSETSELEDRYRFVAAGEIAALEKTVVITVLQSERTTPGCLPTFVGGIAHAQSLSKEP